MAHLPVEGNTAIVRLYLPVHSAAVEIESIEFRPAGVGRAVRVWDFKSQGNIVSTRRSHLRLGHTEELCR